jgi:tetratricopeptide (TPR) repeat protein
MYKTQISHDTKRARLGLCTLVLGYITSSAALAQAPQPQAAQLTPQQIQQLATLEAHIAQHPDHVDALYTYARALIQAQRMAEARSAYLDILRLRPGHLATTMELAMLDQQMQQLESARAGYEQLLRSPDLPPDVRTMVQQRLAQLNQALKTHQIYGSATLGFTAQHNANAGPAGREVEILDNLYPLWASAQPRSDVLRSASASLGWRWNWNNLGDYWQANGSVLTALPHHVSNNRREQLSLHIGPTFSLKRWGMQGLLGVQAKLQRIDVARARYLDSHGLELNANWALTPQQLLTATFGHHIENYAKNSVHAFGDKQSQHRNAWSLGWQYEWNGNSSVYARWVHERRSAHAHQYSQQHNMWTLGASTRYASPAAWSPGQWRSSIYASYAHKRHGAPDAKLNLHDVQRTKQYSVGISQQIPLTKALSANAGLSWLRVRSNYDMATYNDRSVNVSATYAF